MDDKYEKKMLIAVALTLLLAGAAVLIYSLRSQKNQETQPEIQKEWSVDSSPADPSLSVSSPSASLDLANWKLTLPINKDGESQKPLDIFQPELSAYEIDPWFRPTQDKQGMIFRAPVNAPTTTNSDYPRSELREMTDNGTKEAFWPSTSGKHTLYLDQAITATPKNKPDVVAGQIHGDDDDLIVVRLEGQKLYLARSKKNLATLDENYTLGKRFTVRFVAEDGKIKIYYNGNASPIYTLKKEVKHAYFKAGVYTQSNCETEESADLCRADNYGEVIIYQIVVTHEKV